MKNNNVSIGGLYYRYGSKADEEIKEYLNKIKIYKNKTHEIDLAGMNKIIDKPRSVALTFIDNKNFNERPLNGLEEFKTIIYLCKSSSRFYLKNDIGEIFDQIYFPDLCNLKAISFNDNYELIEGTEGEHFLMQATLYK